MNLTDNELFAINLAARGNTEISRRWLADALTGLADTYQPIIPSDKARHAAMFRDLAFRIGQMPAAELPALIAKAGERQAALDEYLTASMRVVTLAPMAKL